MVDSGGGPCSRMVTAPSLPDELDEKLRLKFGTPQEDAVVIHEEPEGGC